MAAAPKHITKYIALHRHHYPTSSMLLLTNSFADILYPSTLHTVRLHPAILAIQSSLRITSSPRSTAPSILLHVFSNGGSNLATELAVSYHRLASQPLPIRALIVDSAPGTAQFRSAIRAVSYSLPRNLLLYYPSLLLLIIFNAFYSLYLSLTFSTDPITLLRPRLNDPTLFPSTAPRCYLYSRADRLVDWRDVEAHADRAAAMGWKVRKLAFEGTEHAGHVRGQGNEQRYVAAVDETWREGGGSSMMKQD